VIDNGTATQGAQVKAGLPNAARGNYYLTVEEVADYLKLSVVTVYMYARNGVLPASKLGKHWRFSVRHLDEWLARSAQPEETVTAQRHAVVVDPDAGQAQSLSEWLREKGIVGHCATSGETVANLVRQTACASIFVDLSTPGFGGVAMLRHIKELRPDMDVAIMADQFDESMMNQALEIGTFSLLRKPLAKEHVLALLK
jgi:two-component system, response regulator, stage 0 sporulation protein F